MPPPADDSDPGKLVPVLLERIASLRTEMQTQTMLLRDLDQRVRFVEQERSRGIDELRDQIATLQQWRRDQETAKAAEAKASEPWRAIMRRGIEVIVVLSVGGAAAALWRVLTAKQ